VTAGTAPKTRGFSLIEVSVAVAVVAAVLLGGAITVKTFVAPATKYDATLDQVTAYESSSEKIDHDLREARTIVYPRTGGPPTGMVVFRNFDGRLVSYYFSKALRQLRRVKLDPGGLAVEDPRPVLANLDAAYFQVNPNGLVSWGLFSSEMCLLGSVGRENR
jgi:prepilin-type N-terminal cleavage/methylation domain-containing protein